MKQIVFVTSSENPKLCDSDTLLIKPFYNKGFEVQTAPWDKRNINWKDYSCIIFRSCWNYPTKIYAFLQWLGMIKEKNILVFNPLKIIEWNYHKKYLLTLNKQGIPIIPTILIKKNTSISLTRILNQNNWNTAVVKPAVGASAYRLFLTSKDKCNQDQKIVNTLLTDSDILIQKYITEITTLGETSYIFIGGEFSHAVRKLPKKGDFRTNYKFGASEKKVYPDKTIINNLKNILGIFDQPLLYARLDGIEIQNKFILMELELIEPYLFMTHHPESAKQFVESFIRLYETKNNLE